MEGLFQPTHLFLILLVVLIIFGPGKLPDLGRGLGKGIREFKESIKGDSNSQSAVKPQPAANIETVAPEVKVEQPKA